MPTLALQIQAEYQNVTGLVPADGVESALMLRLECTSCREVHPNLVALDPANVDELSKSRGEANLVVSCPACRKENSASYVVRKPGSKEDAKMGEIAPWTPLKAQDDAAPTFHTLCTVEFRGLNPLDVKIDELLPPSHQWACTGTESGTTFSDVQFEDGEWHDYDDEAGDEVGITDVAIRWQKV